MLQKIGIAALAVIAVCAGAIGGYQASVQQRVLPGVTIGGQPVGGLEPSEARQKVQQATQGRDSKSVSVTFEDHNWTATAADLGLRYDVAGAIVHAFAIGHGAPLWDGLAAELALLRQPANVDLRLQASDSRFSDWISDLAAGVDRPLEEASLRVEGSSVTVMSGQDGRQVDQAGLETAIQRALLMDTSEPIELPMRIQPRTRTAEQLSGAETELRSVLDPKPMTLTLAGRSWLVSPAAWQTSVNWSLPPAPATDPVLAFDGVGLRTLVEGIAAQTNHPSRDAKLAWGANGLTVIQPSTDGIVVDVGATVAAMERGIRDGEKIVPVVANTPSPRISDSNLAALGIKELVSSGTSNFSYSPWERVVNVKKMASLLNGTLIAPGEEFSFNNVMGDIDPREGWAEGLVILGGRTVPGLGGGICQVSTTTFRGAFLAGLPITERHDHDYPVPYYTQDGSPEGFDATVWSPDLDLKFVNDTPGYLLLQTRLDTSSEDLAVNFYGTKAPGRSVTMAGPSVSNVRPAPAPRHIIDPRKPKGYVEQTDWPHPGMHAVLRRTVTDASGTRTDDFVSDYTPWSAVFIEGPKDDPQAAPGAPPAPGSTPTATAPAAAVTSGAPTTAPTH